MFIFHTNLSLADVLKYHVLRSTVFLVYINDLPNVTCDTITDADDTTLNCKYVQASDLRQLGSWTWVWPKRHSRMRWLINSGIIDVTMDGNLFLMKNYLSKSCSCFSLPTGLRI